MALDFKSGAASFTLNGNAGRASVSLPGVKPGDVIIRIWSISTTSDGPIYFDWTDQYEPVITVADEIQKTTYGDQTGVSLFGALIR